MGRRGFKSVNELLIADGPNGPMGQRPDAPYNLTDLEAEEWRAIVGAMNPGYFARSHYAQLGQLCRHIVASNRIAQLIESVCKQKRVDEERLNYLLAMQVRETNAITRLCAHMRLSHQSLFRYESTKQRPKPLIEAPWDKGKDNFKDDVEEDEEECSNP